MQPNKFRAAVQLAQQGDRARAYQLLCQVLRATPRFAPAWLWMSGLVDDPAHQRDCLERTLLLDPHCTPARIGLDLLQQRSWQASSRSVSRESVLWVLGAYLVKYGFLTEAQRTEALAEQHHYTVTTGEQPMLGTLLLAKGWITPHGLATVLMLQQQEQLAGPYARPPMRLGEYLVVQEHLTVEQLATVLAQQMQLDGQGMHARLGTLLLRDRYVTRAVIDQTLERQRKQSIQLHVA